MEMKRREFMTLTGAPVVRPDLAKGWCMNAV
jgi:hypothetical protein